MNERLSIVCCVLFTLANSAAARGESGNAELAQDLTNPVADLVTVPVQMNLDRDIGSNDEGTKLTTNVQPVVPFRVSENVNLITRTILPVIYQEDVFPGAGSQFGLGDMLAKLFFSPDTPAGSLLWGVGPVFLLPTATDAKLGAEQWGAGPAAVVVAMRGPWTAGFLGNHVWSFAGEDDRPDLNNSFMQPFAAYTWSSAWTLSLQSETSYNWEIEQWSAPVNLGVSKLVMLGRLPVSLQGGVGYWADSPDAGPEGFRFRLQANFVLPK